MKNPTVPRSLDNSKCWVWDRLGNSTICFITTDELFESSTSQYLTMKDNKNFSRFWNCFGPLEVLWLESVSIIWIYKWFIIRLELDFLGTSIRIMLNGFV